MISIYKQIKMRIKFFLIFFILLALKASSQKVTTITYRYKADSLKKDSFYFFLVKPLGLQAYGESPYYPDKLISVKHLDGGIIESTCQYPVSQISFGFLGSGFGYKTFIVPGDKLLININSGTQPKIKINGKYPRPWFNTIVIEGKNKFVYALFDSLANRFGALGWSEALPFRKTDTLNRYCNTASDKYTAECQFLFKYCKEYQIDDYYRKLAKSEIYASYITNLLRPLARGVNLDQYPKYCRAALLDANFNDSELYFSTSGYNLVAYSYACAINRLQTGNQPFSNADLISIYNAIKKNYADTIRNHLLTHHLSTFLGNPELIYPAFDSLLTDYKSFCHNKPYHDYLDSAYNVRKSLATKTYDLKDAMHSKVADVKDNFNKLNNLLSNRPVLIICWASWCVPCIKEMPFEKKLQQEFKGKVDFIYLSFDKDKVAWKSKSEALKLEDNNYIVSGNFLSDFARFYKINSLPNYFLYDKTGKRIETNDLRPSDAGFSEILKHIN